LRQPFNNWTTGLETSGGYDVGYTSISQPTHWMPLPPWLVLPPRSQGTLSMNNTDDGGQAFPVAWREINEGGQSYPAIQAGMSLRDWFAGQAMAAIIAKIPAAYGKRTDFHTYKSVALGAYDYADAMLAARANKETSA
jgi:hypothetical protein